MMSGMGEESEEQELVRLIGIAKYEGTRAALSSRLEHIQTSPPSSQLNTNNDIIARIERSSALTANAISREEERSERENDDKYERNSARSDTLDSVKLRVDGVLFEVKRDALLRIKDTFFHGLLSGSWQPDADGAFSIPRPATGFDRILVYLSSGELSLEGLTQIEEECVYSNLDFFLIPYSRRWHYNTVSTIRNFSAYNVLELQDGRFCGANMNDILVWDKKSIQMQMEGHTLFIHQIIQLLDGRLCSCSSDGTIKLWSIDTGLCEHTFEKFRKAERMIQLLDGRVCSGGWDETIGVWNLSTGECELSWISAFQARIRSVAQLADGRICCGWLFDISIHSLLTGECEQSWRAHDSDSVSALVCIGATRLCSFSGYEENIRVWKTSTGECERTLEFHSGLVTCIILMQDGRLCSSSADGTLKLWNLETGECENTLVCSDKEIWQVLQLKDGRLFCVGGDAVMFIA